MGDSVGAILAYDALCLDSSFKRASSDGSINEEHLIPSNNHGSTGNVNYDGGSISGAGKILIDILVDKACLSKEEICLY